MQQTQLQTNTVNDIEPTFDIVGSYNQDEINGFAATLLDEFVKIIDPQPGEVILDAMGGDGNLTDRLSAHCKERYKGKLPHFTLLEYSKVQCQFAKLSLAETGAQIVWGDILTLTDRATDAPLPLECFDRVVIKSANHEISEIHQGLLYTNIFSLLKPGGLFVNLGFLFDIPEERDEFREITRVKDSLAGMDHLVANRHFLTRSELYSVLEKVGFIQTTSAKTFNYTIRSSVAAKHYFKSHDAYSAHIDLQISQVKATRMRSNDRIKFERDETVMLLPGEVTTCIKPKAKFKPEDIYNTYPYDFLPNIRMYRSLLDDVSSQIRIDSSVLDLACGTGHLADRLRSIAARYIGIDISEEFVDLCKGKLSENPPTPDRQFSFISGDLNSFVVPGQAFDNATILNAIYQPSIKPVQLLHMALNALKDGGKCFVSGPSSCMSFANIEHHIISQLASDGLLEGNEEVVSMICEANRHLMSEHGNYWSCEGMAELMLKVGYSRITHLQQIYEAQGYLVVAEK